MAGVYTHCSQEAPASRPNQQLLWHVFETFAILLAICVFTRPQGRLSHAAGLSFSPRLSEPVSVLPDCWRQALLGSTAGGFDWSPCAGSRGERVSGRGEES